MSQKVKDRLINAAMIIFFISASALLFYLDFFTNVFGG